MKEGRPSASAFRIAYCLALAAKDPTLRPVLAAPDEPYPEWFVAEHSPEAARQLGPRGADPLPAWQAAMLAKGGFMDVLLRKRFIEGEVRRAVADGVRQVVVLGAGFDTLALRLAAGQPELRLLELDHPATQEVKRRALERKAALPAALALVAADLTRAGAQEALRAAGLLPDRPAVFVAEGLLMYLSPEEVDGVFELVARNGAPSRFVFTMTDTNKMAEASHEVSAAGGEPLRSHVDPRDLPEFLGRRGFRLLDWLSAVGLEERYFRPLGIDARASGLEFVAAAVTPP